MGPIAGVLLAAWTCAQEPFPRPLLAVAEPEVLERLEEEGLGFAALVEGASAEGLDLRELSGRPGWGSIVRVLGSDLEALRARDPRLGVGMRSSRRLFDRRWLSSPYARFELAGVVNRLDRAPFSDRGCGEVRLIYRLAYRKGVGSSAVYSRLPVTANVVFWALDADGGRDCRAVARRWLIGGGAEAASLVSEGGPLAPALLAPGRLKSVEFNLQSVRWPSTMRPDLAGHAEYMLRVFRRDGEGYALAPLENTPDVDRLRAEPRLKAELLSWLSEPERLRLVDLGTVVIPERFLARRADSYALHGASRLANRPFTRLLARDDLAGLSLDGYRVIRSTAALLRRLDDMACAGCHQARTVAGFHFLGRDRPGTDPVNAIVSAHSPHLLRDLLRREAYVLALARGEAPDESRPLSERSDSGEGGYGSHCGLPGSAFGSWTCGTGLSCMAADAAEGDGVGECLPPEPSGAGDPCETGLVTQREDPLQDRIVSVRRRDCGPGSVCEASSVGFPGGMCSSGCSALRSGEACGRIAVLAGFNSCLARGRPFGLCLRENVRPAALRACGPERPCRDDYLCAGTRESGACIPPYFLFQARLDGHPPPL